MWVLLPLASRDETTIFKINESAEMLGFSKNTEL